MKLLKLVVKSSLLFSLLLGLSSLSAAQETKAEEAAAVFRKAGQAVTGAFETMKKTAEIAFSAAEKKLTEAQAEAQSYIEKAKQATSEEERAKYKAYAKKILDEIREDANNALNKIKEGSSSIGKSAAPEAQAAKAELDELYNNAKSQLSNLQGKAIGWWETFKEKLGTGGKSAKEWFSGIFTGKKAS